MRPGHRNVQDVSVTHFDIPGAVQIGGRGRAAGTPAQTFHARSGNGADLPRHQIHCSDGVIVGIRYVQRIAIQRHALRCIEGRFAITPVIESHRPRTDDIQYFVAAQVGDHDAVVTAVGNEQTVAYRVNRHFAGKGQRAARMGGRFQLNRQRVTVDFAQSIEIADHAPDHPVKILIRDFSRLHREQVAAWVNNHESRPCAHTILGIGIPYLEVAVIDDRMFQSVSLHNLPDVYRLPLIAELG